MFTSLTFNFLLRGINHRRVQDFFLSRLDPVSEWVKGVGKNIFIRGRFYCHPPGPGPPPPLCKWVAGNLIISKVWLVLACPLCYPWELFSSGAETYYVENSSWAYLKGGHMSFLPSSYIKQRFVFNIIKI